VVLGGAAGEHADDVLDPAALDVGDIGLHPPASRARPRGAPHALLQAGLQPRDVHVDEAARGLQVMALVPDLREAQHGKLAGAEALLERLELAARERAVADVRLDAVTLAQRGGELA
jgi:hypothetical protein